MIVYLDTSVILAKLLEESRSVKDWGHWSQACSSELTRVEACRAIDRLRLEGKLDGEEVSARRQRLGEILGSVDLIRIDAAILQKAAGGFPTVINTLDAIYLSTAVLYAASEKIELSILTHDRQLRTAARALNLPTPGWD